MSSKAEWWVVDDMGVHHGPCTWSHAKGLCLTDQTILKAANKLLAAAAYEAMRATAEVEDTVVIPVKCPRCGAEDSLSELDLIPGRCSIQGVTPQGIIVFAGETDVDWDGQYEAHTPARFACDACQAEDILRHEFVPGASPDIVAPAPADAVDKAYERVLAARNCNYKAGQYVITSKRAFDALGKAIRNRHLTGAR